ncbi:Unknown protein sequence [Pseudomonas amygdali pv. lachrymans]|nr:Unknown protein sequence [Pseudomonas amygdali pv. lachrymans]
MKFSQGLIVSAADRCSFSPKNLGRNLEALALCHEVGI